jgi:hypothetical protein
MPWLTDSQAATDRSARGLARSPCSLGASLVQVAQKLPFTLIASQ